MTNHDQTSTHVHHHSATSRGRLQIKSAIKAGIRGSGLSDPNHNQTRVKLTIKSAIKAGIRIGGMSDSNHNQTQIGRR